MAEKVRCPLCGAEAERLELLLSFGTCEIIACACVPKTKPWVWVSPALARDLASASAGTVVPAALPSAKRPGQPR